MVNPAAGLKSTMEAQIAEAFVSSRLAAHSISAFPGAMPEDLDAAYAIQDAAIDMWPDEIQGWKVGRIGSSHQQMLGVDRLAGPAFAKQVHVAPTSRLELPAFQPGFAAIEGEVAAVIGRDAPAGQTQYTTEEALDYISNLHLGAEVASSPYSEINDHGPLVTISDFGNNYGLVLGAEIPDWRALKSDGWVFSVAINGEEVGRAHPEPFPGGAVESVRFLLENTARRGRPLRSGMIVLTGAITGVHRAQLGDEAEIACAGCEPISCTLVSQRTI